jgi:hypothetical protein
MGAFYPITEADLARARCDPAFRRHLLAQSLEALLAGMKRLRGTAAADDGKGQMRESVELAVRLAELIQSSAGTERES